MDFVSNLQPSGLAGSVVNLFGQGLNNMWQSRQATLQNKQNMELSKYQFLQNQKMFNMANAYNSPLQQMERFKQAGLNPNLIYGQGTPGNAPNVLPQYRAPEFQPNIMKPVNPSETMNATLSMLAQVQQLKNLQAEGRILDTKAVKGESEKPYYADTAEYNFMRLIEKYFVERFAGAEAEAKYGAMFRLGGQKGRNLFEREMTPLGAELLGTKVAYDYMNRPTKILEKYNADIALANAREQWQQKLIGGYLPPLTKTLIQAGSALGGGLIRGGLGLFSKVSGIGKLAPKGLNPMGRYNPRINIYGK